MKSNSIDLFIYLINCILNEFITFYIQLNYILTKIHLLLLRVLCNNEYYESR